LSNDRPAAAALATQTTQSLPADATQPSARRGISRRALIFGAAAALPVAVSGYAVAIEPRRGPLVTTYQISPPDWRPSDGLLRIGVVADLHACDPFMPVHRIEEIIDAANWLEPDIFVLLGDFLEGLNGFYAKPIPMADWANPMAQLRSPLGSFAILGNHDWWHDPTDNAGAIRATLEARSIPVLENDAVLIRREGTQGFWLGGLGDQLAFKGTGRGVDDMGRLLSQIPDDGRPAILLAHEPDVFPQVPARFGLTLSGHTHGGQVALPLIGRFPVASHYGQRYSYGHVFERNRHLIVSAGLGVSGFPVRLGVQPELVLVEVGAPETLALHNAQNRAEQTAALAI
jgi:predicted MPP superfamily phosphohydrolase